MTENQRPERSGAISQDELRKLYSLEQDFMKLRDRYYAERNKMLLRINAGQHQEAGKYGLRKRFITRRTLSYRDILIELKGVKWVEQRRIETAIPHRFVKLEFADIGPKGVGR